MSFVPPIEIDGKCPSPSGTLEPQQGFGILPGNSLPGGPTATSNAALKPEISLGWLFARRARWVKIEAIGSSTGNGEIPLLVVGGMGCNP